jgi:hypothetical protein
MCRHSHAGSKAPGSTMRVHTLQAGLCSAQHVIIPMHVPGHWLLAWVDLAWSDSPMSNHRIYVFNSLPGVVNGGRCAGMKVLKTAPAHDHPVCAIQAAVQARCRKPSTPSRQMCKPSCWRRSAEGRSK